MDIVIVADFCGNFENNGNSNSRFIYLAKMLARDNGADVEIITSDFYHEAKRYFRVGPTAEEYQVTVLHEPQYPTNICLKRFYSHYVWGKNLKTHLKKRKKPDVIYCAMPTLKAAKEAMKYCKKNNIRFIVDIQDLWPEAFKMIFRIPVVSDIIFAPFSWLANRAYKGADEIIAVSDTYVNRALKVNRKCKSGHTVFLGTRLETFDENVRNNAVEKPADELWLGYCGTLGASYDITCVLDALAIVKEKGMIPPKFIVMGDGPRKEEFEKYAKKKNVDTVFTGRLPYDKMCGMLSACDIVVNPILKGSAASIINKHGDYASSGLPVINNQDSQEYRALIEKYNLGLNCRNGDSADMAEKLSMLIYDQNLRTEMGKNARRCAEEKFDRKNSYKEIIDVFLKGE